MTRTRRQRLRKPGLWCALAFALAIAPLQAADTIRVVPLVRNGHVLVSFELAQGFTEEIRAAIRSGLTTSFTYTVELRVDVPLWLDRTIAATSVTATVNYDNLTRRHSLALQVDGRMEGALVTEDEQAVRQWMTSFERLPLFDTSILERNREYYVRVRGRARPQTALIPWQWSDALSGHAKFTFIP